MRRRYQGRCVLEWRGWVWIEIHGLGWVEVHEMSGSAWYELQAREAMGLTPSWSWDTGE